MKLIRKSQKTNVQGWFNEPTGYVRTRGFTLLEVISGLAIMVLLVGGIYGIANGALDLGIRSSDARKSAVREMNFSKVIRETLSRCGPEVRVEMRPDQLLLTGGTGLLNVGAGSETADGLEFSFRTDGAVWISHFKNQQRISDLRLMGDLSGFFWECQDPVSGNWIREWNVNGDLRPELIRMRTLRGDREETEVFWIPNYRKEIAEQR